MLDKEFQEKLLSVLEGNFDIRRTSKLIEYLNCSQNSQNLEGLLFLAKQIQDDNKFGKIYQLNSIYKSLRYFTERQDAETLELIVDQIVDSVIECIETIKESLGELDGLDRIIYNNMRRHKFLKSIGSDKIDELLKKEFGENYLDK